MKSTLTKLLELCKPLGLLVLAGMIAGPGLPGQTPTAEESEVEELSPFTVTGDSDIGYLAGNSVSGSRFNMKLSETAATISVFTEEFLKDLGATNIADVIEYGVNSNVDFDQNRPDPTMFYTDAGLSTDTRINNRGLLGSQLLDFFGTKLPVDTYNTGRFDFASGPNSVLFGISNASGSISVSTKQAEFTKTKLSGTLQTGSWDRMRATMDANVVAIEDTLAVRVMGVHDESESWRHWNFKEVDRYTASIRVQPVKKLGTNLVASFEQGEIADNWYKPYNFSDSTSYWETLPDSVRLIDNLSASYRTGTVAAAAGVFRRTNHHVLVVNDDRSLSTQANLGGIDLYESASYFEGSNFFDAIPGFIDRRFRDTNSALVTLLPESEAEARANAGTNFSKLYAPFEVGFGPDARRDAEIDRIYLRLEQPIGKHLFLELAYQKEEAFGTTFLFTGETALFADPNRTIPNGSGGTVANPRVGQYYIEGAPWRNLQDDNTEAFRASLFGNFDLGIFGDHKVLGLFEDVERYFTQGQGNMVMVNSATKAPITTANVTSANNRINLRTYVTPGEDFEDWYPGTFLDLEQVTINGTSFDTGFVNSARFGNLDNTQTMLLATQSAFFNQRMFVTAGYRWDEFRNRTLASAALAATDERVTSGERFAGDLELVEGQYLADRTTDFKTYTLGAIFNVTGNLSVFANQATNIAPTATNRYVITTDFQNPEPTEGLGRDAGIMIRLRDDRVVVRMTYFETEVTGDPTNRASQAVQSHDRILSAFKSTTNPGTGAVYLPPATVDPMMVHLKQGRGYNSGLLDGLANINASGFETDVKLNLTSSWTLTAAYSYTELEKTDIFAEWDAWFAGVRPTLEQFGDPAGLRDQLNTAVDVSTEIDSMQVVIQDTINSGSFGFNNRPHKFNLFTRYSFKEGPLKGAFVGGGVRWQSKNQVQRAVTGFGADNAFIYGPTLEGPEIFEVDGLAGYQGKTTLFSDRPAFWRVQFNVSNLLDNEEAQILRYSLDGSRLWRTAARNPVNYRLTLSIDL